MSAGTFDKGMVKNYERLRIKRNFSLIEHDSAENEFCLADRHYIFQDLACVCIEIGIHLTQV